MAKGNMFLGQAKGKVGSIVFSRALGKQVSRTKPSSVKNPKTRAQNAQRAILATVAKAASIMTPIVDHSFAGVAYGAESVRHFRKINLNQLRALYMDGDTTGFNLTPKGGAVVPNSYIVSQGNLPAFQMHFDPADFGFTMGGASLNVGAVSVSTFLQAYPYLQGGDQLTLVQLVKTSGSLENNDAKFVFVYDRIVFAPDAFDDKNSNIITEDGYFEESKLNLTKTTNPIMLELRAVGKVGMLASTTQNVYAAALILSREVNGQWQRSTQEMGLTHEQDVQNIEAAIDSYGASASESEDSEYLNQADDNEDGQKGIRNAYMNVSIKNGKEDAETEYVLAGNTGTTGLEAAAGTVIKLNAVGFDNFDASRKPFITIYKGDTQMKVHSEAIDYAFVLTADTAGAWKVETVFADRSKAEYNITCTIKA